MFTIIKPEILDTWCNNPQPTPDTCAVPASEPPKSKWDKFKSWVTEAYEVITPLINTFSNIIRTASMAVNAFCKFQNYRRQKGNVLWVTA